MGSEAEWYVLVERNKGSSDTEWTLREKIHAEGGRDAALVKAEELTRSYLERGFYSLGDTGRSVFRISETSWLVEVSYSRWPEGAMRPVTSSSHIRISVAELVYFKETPPVEPPPATGGSPGRAFRRG
ncbi:hypothetical protein [Streptomyces sp. NBC_00038]|uniref:hypothetical protein n=1 Tax=Streptomyces sp. NBC_00038 TaxID=2903615 RepID=UPI00225660AC|nr:hypothetical protein [Streptomyces sp. NBC_00038]MCX5558492.1 hypothetical protein [Streptomyces sp. NBC_00038]